MSYADRASQSTMDYGSLEDYSTAIGNWEISSKSAAMTVYTFDRKMEISSKLSPQKL